MYAAEFHVVDFSWCIVIIARLRAGDATVISAESHVEEVGGAKPALIRVSSMTQGVAKNFK